MTREPTTSPRAERVKSGAQSRWVAGCTVWVHPQTAAHPSAMAPTAARFE
ncbi:hypothetical protein A176_003892 [Myxococcus hansupus]|uniref:Uncharacterized protein n=1 Tax=Pseudomyxococcus hansupus TaxID=1297742 RepID=A0A0H4X053_9BACT|nr:hypothetical protein A176_003892 [Myxococcus hansupus]